MSREGYYLPSGLYVEFVTAQGNLLVELNSKAAPATIARLVGQLETNFKPAAFNPAAPRTTTPPPAIGQVTQNNGAWGLSLNGAWPDTAITETLMPAVLNAQSPYSQLMQGKMQLADSLKAVSTDAIAIGQVRAGQELIAKLSPEMEIRQVQ